MTREKTKNHPTNRQTCVKLDRSFIRLIYDVHLVRDSKSDFYKYAAIKDTCKLMKIQDLYYLCKAI